MALSQLLVPNDLNLYVGPNQVKKIGSYNESILVIQPAQEALIFTLDEEVQFTHSDSQSYIVTFSGVVNINHENVPLNGQNLLIRPMINGAPIDDLGEIVSPQVCVISRFNLGYDYANPPNLADVPFCVHFVVSNITDLAGSIVKFNIKVTNNSGAVITYAEQSTNMIVSCLSVV
jgi:hypothetical protein